MLGSLCRDAQNTSDVGSQRAALGVVLLSMLCMVWGLLGLAVASVSGMSSAAAGA
jgi:hypothetical protein